LSRPPHHLPALAGAAAALLPGAASAHLVDTRFGDFYGGLLHLLLSPEHLLPILGLGLLAGLQPPARARWSLAALPLGMLAGLLAALWAQPTAAHPGNAGVMAAATAPWPAPVLIALLGLLVALALRLPAWLLAAVALAVGVVEGLGNGAGIGPDTSVILYLPGVLAAGFVPLALIAAGTLVLREQAEWVPIAIRAAGSWIAAIGLMVAAV
jgi:hydrogenase/urease accessory protein HupE